MKNRLKLDWSLNSATDRKNFVDNYLNNFKNPTSEELETIANYILWGKEDDGTSAVEKKYIEIETRSKTWQQDNTESLDAMMEAPTFNEVLLQHSTTAQPRIRRETFSRTEALKKCPESLRSTFESLFKQIDEIDLCINFYELEHGKRKNPPRAELLKKFSEERQAFLKELTTHWNQYLYLKQRHLLVELRREQFAIRDSYTPTIIRHTMPEPIEPEAEKSFETEIPVYPLGLIKQDSPLSILFKEQKDLNPKSFSENELKKISKFLWLKKEEERPPHFFDFSELEHVYNLFQQISELEESLVDNNTNLLIKTLKYYIELADLSEAQKEILDFKIKKKKNQDIALFINKKYGKSYTSNYISTIFRQKIIPKINAAAIFHLKIVENLFFEEEFKKCNCCGIWLLRDPEIFVRKSRSKDGLANRCKKCDKLDRQKKKKEEIIFD